MESKFNKLYEQIITQQAVIQEGWLGKLAAGTALATSLMAGANAQTVTDLPLPKQPAVTQTVPKQQTVQRQAPKVQAQKPSQISSQGIDARHMGDQYTLDLATKYIIHFEGTHKDKKGNHTVYKDVKGIDTIGYGCTDATLVAKKVITEKEAWDALQTEVTKVRDALKKKFGKHWDVMDNFMQAALISLYFNTGVHKTFKNLEKYVKEHKWELAAKEFLDIDNITVKQNGKEVKKKCPGLTNRRKIESQKIFLHWVNHDKRARAAGKMK